MWQSTTITTEAAFRDLESSKAKTRAAAAFALGDIVDPEERELAVTSLIPVLRDGNPDVRSQAAISLGELQSERAVEPLLAQFSDAAPAARQAAAIALGKLGFSSAFDGLAGALRSGPPDLRFQAATSLVEVDATRAYAPLVEALSDEDGEVVAAAALGLGAIGDHRATGHLANLLDQWGRPETRFDIAFALADLGDHRAIPVLREFVDHPFCGLDAMVALELLEDAQAVDVLAPLLSRRFIEPLIKLRAAAFILQFAPTHEFAETAKETLVRATTARKLHIRGMAVQLLGQISEPWAEAALRDLRSQRRGRELIEEIDEALAAIAAEGARPAL